MICVVSCFVENLKFSREYITHFVHFAVQIATANFKLSACLKCGGKPYIELSMPLFSFQHGIFGEHGDMRIVICGEFGELSRI